MKSFSSEFACDLHVAWINKINFVTIYCAVFVFAS